MQRSLAVFALFLIGCEGRALDFGQPLGAAAPGTNGAPPQDEPEPNPCTSEPSPDLTPLRRLAHEEYRHAAADLFGTTAVSAVVNAQVDGFAADPVSLGFKNSAAFLDVKSVLMQQYFDAAEAIAAKAVEALPALVPCTGDETTCATQFIERFGRRAYRRALSAAERQAFVGLYAQARIRGDDFKTAIEGVLLAFLLSPHFVYRVEVDDVGSGPVRALRPQELATRLSFLFWRSGPDDALLSAAEAGRLGTPQDVEREARRLLADPKAGRLTQLFEEWLDVDELSGLRRDTAAYPGLDPKLGEDLREEVRAFVRSVLLEGDGKLSTLLTSQHTFVNGALAQHYRLPGITGTQWTRVQQPGRRGGLLMLGGALIPHDKEARTSIVMRGLGLRTQLLCQLVPAPPPDIPSLGELGADQTQADRLAQHRSNPSCAGCHSVMDPLGVPLEGFDAVGRARSADERGRALSTLGQLTNTDVDGPVTDGLDLVTKLATSAQVRSCFVTQAFRFTSGRKETAVNACSTFRLQARFAESGGDLRELFVGLTQTDDFLFRRVAP